MEKKLQNRGYTSVAGTGLVPWKLCDDDTVKLLDDATLPTQITLPSVGLPAELLTNFSAKVIESLQSPTTMTEFSGEPILIGDWTITADKYQEAEVVGHVAPYSDFSAAGVVDVNNNWIRRDFYLYQSVINYGDLENERNARAKVNRVDQKQRAAATVLKRFANRASVYGIAGLNIYGLMNNPFIASAMTPDADQNSNTNLLDMDAMHMYEQINRIFLEIIENSQGTVDANSAFVLASSPRMVSAIASKIDNTLNLQASSVFDILKKSYPNLRQVMLPEAETSAGTEIYVRVERVDGNQTSENITNCALRVGRVVQDMSSQRQKYVQGTGGYALYYGFAISHMLNAE